MKETKKVSKNIHECKNKKSFPGGSVVKNQPAREPGLIPELGRSPGCTPVFLPGQYHGQRSQVGYSP